MLQTVMGVISHFHCAIFSHPLTLLSNNDRRIRGETQRSEMQSSNMPTTSRPPSETISLAKVSKWKFIYKIAIISVSNKVMSA